MRRAGTSEELRVAVLVLRSVKGWSQQELAEAARVHRVQISLFESGRRAPSPKTLERLLKASGVPLPTFQALLAVLRQALRGEDIQTSAEEGQSSRQVIQAVTLAHESAKAQVLAATSRGGPRSSEILRREAVEAWARLKAFSPRNRRVLVAGAAEYQTWALCERLCAESLRTAAADPRQAIELAELSLEVASQVAGEESWRLRFQSFALTHLGNARRTADDFEGAEKAFRQARELWDAEEEADPDGILDRGLMLFLEAALRKDQRRFADALALNERAADLAGPDYLGDVLSHLAVTLEQMGDYHRAIEVLEKTRHHIDAQRSPRSALGVRFNLAVNFAQLSRYAEAAVLLPEVREMAVQLGNELDLLRVLWLESRVAVGLGRKAEAMEALSQVRKGFVSRNLGYDAALVSLELAVLFLEDGRTGEVKTLARELAPIFQAKGVHREALAALRLFCDAAEREAVSLEMARRLVQYLEQARREPELRFES